MDVESESVWLLRKFCKPLIQNTSSNDYFSLSIQIFLFSELIKEKKIKWLSYSITIKISPELTASPASTKISFTTPSSSA